MKKPVLAELMERITALEEELEAELAERRRQFQFIRHGGAVQFDELLRSAHRKLRVGLARYLWNAHWSMYLTAPVIYALILPLAVCDGCFTLYQWICFPAYGIPRVSRGAYFVMDRHHLVYLNQIEKLNCAYCGYANGVISYAREIASRTEQYWCPIKHARKIVGAHKRYLHFLEYGDAEGYRGHLEEIREQVRSYREGEE